MRVLITGCKGMVGRKLCEHLSIFDSRYELRGFDSGKDLDQWMVDWHHFKDSMYCTPDMIVHTGAVSSSHATGNRVWELNCEATRLLADEAASWGSKFLFFSSCAAIEPSSDYGWSKRFSEDYLRARLDAENLCIFRPFNIWDISDNEKLKENPSIVYKIFHNSLDCVYSGCVRDFIHCCKVAVCVEEQLRNWEPGLWELGTGKGVLIENLARTCSDMRDEICMPPIVECPQDVPLRLVADPYNIFPRHDFDEVWNSLKGNLRTIYGKDN